MQRYSPIVLAIVLTSTAWAGHPSGPPPFEPLIDALELSEDQIEPVRSILDNHHAQMRSLDEEMRAERRLQREELDAATDAELANILSPGQLETFQEMRARRPHRGPRRPQYGNALRAPELDR